MASVEKSYSITPTGIGRRDFSKNVERYDQEPTLLLFEDFEHLPPSFSSYGSAGYSVQRVTDRAWRGGACVRLRTGGAPARLAQYEQYFGFVPSRKLLGDLMFSLPSANGYIARFSIDRRTGTQLISFRVSYRMDLNRWQYVGPSGLYVDIPGGDQNLARDVFHHVTLAVNFVTEQYLYMSSNELFINLAGLTPYKVADLARPEAHCTFSVASFADGVDFYIDNVRVREIM